MSWVCAGTAAVLTVAASLVSTVFDGTRRSVIESGSGHLQIYNPASADRPELLSRLPPRLEPFPDYSALSDALAGVSGVAALVPMETGMAEVFRGNLLDEKLAALRRVAASSPSPDRGSRFARASADVRRAVEQLNRERRAGSELLAQGLMATEDTRALERAASPEFWEALSADPLEAIEFLENRIARQLGEGEVLELSYLGTDLDQFARAFPRFEMVTGRLPPAGSRGILLGHGAYEEQFKWPIAYRLDLIHRARERGGLIDSDQGLSTLVNRNLAELDRAVAALAAERTEALGAALSGILGHGGELGGLFREFLTVSDANFDGRYQEFYRELAPHLPLYRVTPGEPLTLRGVAWPGVNAAVRVFGSFRFKGLGGDGNPVNTISLLDLTTARSLSGRQTAEQAEEAARLVADNALPEVPEAPVFSAPVQRPEVADAEPVASAEGVPELDAPVRLPDTFNPGDLPKGPVVQAAVVLRPGASVDAVREDMERVARRLNLALGVAGWGEVSGVVGQVANLSRGLWIGLAGVFGTLVLLVSGGALLLLAGERVGEIGTFRALGMSRRQVFGTLLLEALFLGLVGGGGGAMAGTLLLRELARRGVAVTDEPLQLFLGGPVLMPNLVPWHPVAVAVGIAAVVAMAALVPAWQGSHVSPAVALRRREDVA